MVCLWALDRGALCLFIRGRWRRRLVHLGSRLRLDQNPSHFAHLSGRQRRLRAAEPAGALLPAKIAARRLRSRRGTAGAAERAAAARPFGLAAWRKRRRKPCVAAVGRTARRTRVYDSGLDRHEFCRSSYRAAPAAGALHQFLPLDVPQFLARFLDYWRPDLALIADSEIWPNLFLATRRRKIPLLLINARISQSSFQRWRWFPRFIATVLANVDLCLAQSEADAEAFCPPWCAACQSRGKSQIRCQCAARRPAEPCGARRAHWFAAGLGLQCPPIAVRRRSCSLRIRRWRRRSPVY